QALPYLMEFPYECSEQVFNRLYANGLAGRIASSDPKIRRIFDRWKGSKALTSNLEKNQDLKSALLQESPWVLEAKNETQAKRNIGSLFDENTLAASLKAAYAKLAAMQLGDGSWPWFPGGRGDSYITLYLVTGFGRLLRLGVSDVPQDLALKAIDHLDKWIDEVYRDILKDKTQVLNHLSPTIALYLYGRSFYLKDKPVPAKAREAVDYFLKQGAKFWLEIGNRQSQAHLAVGLKRFGDAGTPGKIMRSMKERSKLDPEMGRYWAETEAGWWWYRAPIETQAMMIEAFDEVAGDAKAVEECKIWLLKQKQTRDWKTTKATADAVYALVLRGASLLASDAPVEVRLGGQVVPREGIEAGTGFYEKRYGPGEIKPAMGDISVKKTDPGIAWGGVHWQYLEDIAKITPQAQNPLTLKKTVFVRRATAKGPVIEPVRGPLAVGDTLVVRIELRTDRDMEYVHMKDHRGSGLEPVNVLSQYKYQDGLAYYESTKDTASHFFIDYLPKGTYIFEYPLRVVHRGTYQNGMAHIECMYAPEFNSHSASVELVVK
ncbi:MAG: alpha-2-macroglobulin family protein, partial [Acidobacteriota bacterium]|nr:alpha-2-macroglobulin family protein [Acidobacteriota bacterium]